MRGTPTSLFVYASVRKPLDYSLGIGIDYLSINILGLERIGVAVGIVYLTILSTISSLG